MFDKHDTNCHHIFFDDNATPGETSNIDTRDVMSGDTILWKKALGRYVVWVDPLRVIAEPDYFVKEIE